jgi:glutathione S-transferase
LWDWARQQQMPSFIDAELANGPSIADIQFTVTDLMKTFPFTKMRLFLDYDLVPFTNILAHLGRVEARSAYRRAMALANPAPGA